MAGKPEAAAWCLQVLDPRRHDLVRRAVADRPDPWVRITREGDPELAERTGLFVEHVTGLVREAAAGPVRDSGAATPGQ